MQPLRSSRRTPLCTLGLAATMMAVGACASTTVDKAPDEVLATQAAPTTPAPPTVINIVPYETHGHRAVNVTVSGKTVPFLFDTGGGVTLVTPDIATAAGCTPFGQLTGYRMRGERVDFQRCDNFSYTMDNVTVDKAAVGVFDLNRLIPPQWPRLGGLVALSSFEGQVVTVDLAAGQVSVRAPQHVDRNAGAPLNIVRQASGYSVVALVPSPTPTGTLWLELDSGSDAPLMLSPSAAKLLGVDLDTADVEHHPAVAAADGVPPRAESWKVPRVSIELPGIGAVETSATVLDIIYDGNIGAPLMEKYRWTLNLAHRRVQIEPTVSPTRQP